MINFTKRTHGIGALIGLLALTVPFAQAQDINTGQEPAERIGCVIKPSEVINLNSIISGQVSEVLVKRGELVQEGQVIIKLDSSLAQSDYNLAKARADSTADIELARERVNATAAKLQILKDGRSKGVVSVIDYKTGQADYAQALALLRKAEDEHQILAVELERAAILLEKTQIKSPVNAIIGEDLIGVGEAVDQEPVATLLVTNPLRIEAFVPTHQVVELSDRKDYLIRVQNFNDLEFNVSFDFIAPSAEISSNTTRAYFLLDSNDVPPGVQCSLVLED